MKQSLTIYSPQMSLKRENPYGGGVYDANVLRELAGMGAKLIIPLIFHLDHETCEGWSVRVIPIRRGFKLGAILTNLVFFVHAVWSWFIKKERWDVFRISDPYYTGICGIVFARLTGVKTLCQFHHLEEPFHRNGIRERLIRWVAVRSDFCVAPSKFCSRQLQEYLSVSPDKILIANPSPPQVIEMDDDVQPVMDLPDFSDRQVCLFLGSLIPRKNVEKLLEAFTFVRKSNENAVLVIAGKAPVGYEAYERNLSSKAESLGLADAVHFLGFIDGWTKRHLLKAADVFAFPSRLEGFGIAPSEAMSYGTPCVVSPYGGIPEVVEDGVTGLVADPDHPGEFGAAISRILDDDDLRQRLGVAGRKDVTTRFSWKKSATKMLEAMREAFACKAERSLGVLLNAGDSLAHMKQDGQADRFVKQYLNKYIISYCNIDVYSYVKEEVSLFENVHFLPGRPTLPGLLYGIVLPIIYRRRMKQYTVLRVMQTLGAMPAVVANLVWGTPYVTTYGFDLVENLRLQKGGLYPFAGKMIRYAGLKRARFVIVTTPSLATDAEKWVPCERIRLIPNGVDLSRFSPKDDYNIPDNRPARCLYVGRMVNQKNLHELLVAISMIDRPVVLHLVGEGPMREDLEKAAQSLGIDARFSGPVPFDEMPDVYRQADLYVLPSLGEGHPKVLIEAFATGLPCVGTDVRGVRDVIDHERTGLLCKPAASSIARSIMRLLENPAQAKALGIKAREKAEKEYDLKELLDREIQLLREAETT